MAFGGPNDQLMSDINVTPLVDVMLVLLIIFMVTAPMMVQGVKVDLPEASTEPMSSEEEHLVVTIDNNGQIFLNDYQVGVEFLNEKLSKILEGRDDREVFMRADKTVPYGTVVRVMAEIKGAGIEKLGMITDPLEESETSSRLDKIVNSKTR